MVKQIEHSSSLVGKEEKKALGLVIDSNFLAEGAAVTCFEREVANYIGCSYALATSTGTAALHLALLTLGVGKGDEVIIPNYVCRSVLNAVQYCQATPVLCDVDRKTYNILPQEVKKKVNCRSQAIIVAHMFGCPAPVKELSVGNIPIIEDCAQSIGAVYKGKRVGTLGDISIFSFEGTKTLTTGEGGMVLTNSKKIYKKLLALKEPYAKTQMLKYTYRMSSLQAAVGRVQLKKLPFFLKRRRKIAEIYEKAFSSSEVETPFVPEEATQTFHRYMLTIEKVNIERFLQACWKQGVLVKRPIKPYTLNQYLGIPNKLFPNSRFVMNHCASIPIYPALSNKDVKIVIDVVNQQLKKLGI